ncbi:MAG: prephenate dehydratase [Halobacteriovoraceae bacterium]|nr:prephenate dehydratase [Halobacteriovoraceae bacterium]|tara:strand:+ start:109259 stop:110089 length:831 start_codon:yes stop_codon:yes gene_type:complete
MKVAFQGEKGAYSEVALRNFFNEEVEAIGYELSEEVTDALLNKEVAMAILPVENSIVGNVNVNLDLLYKHPLFAIGEVYQNIHHHLLANKGAKIEELTKAYSHPIALAQCRNFLNKNSIQPVADYDTAGSCKLLKERGTLNEAAIGSYLCAETYGLEILSDDIQETQNNITRFLALVREEEIPESLLQTKTSIAFSANHRPGALLDCLQIFKKYNINLTKLESRPIPEDPFQYIFFVDFLSGIKESNTIQCLQELNQDAHHVKVLGSYPKGHKEVN